MGAMLALALAFEARAQAIEPGSAEDNYVQGNFLFLAYHEAGHLIMDQVMDLDQSGDRRSAEETADDIATWMMLPDPDEPEQDEQVVAAVLGWLQSANEAGDATGENPHYPSDDDRASRIACLLYGGNPNLYADIADAFWEKGSADVCVDEHQSLQEDFEEWFGDALIPPAEPSAASVRYEYQEPDGADAGVFYAYQYLSENEMLEDFAEDIVEFIRLPNDVGIVAQSCGEGVAEFRYSPDARLIIVCYEAVDWFIKRAALGPEAFGPSAGGGAGAADDGSLGSGGGRVKKKPVKR
jgi:hypothetical protein